MFPLNLLLAANQQLILEDVRRRNKEKEDVGKSADQKAKERKEAATKKRFHTTRMNKEMEDLERKKRQKIAQADKCKPADVTQEKRPPTDDDQGQAERETTAMQISAGGQTAAPAVKERTAANQGQGTTYQRRPFSFVDKISWVHIDPNSEQHEIRYTLYNGKLFKMSRLQLLKRSELELVKISKLLEKKTPDERRIAKDIDNELARRRKAGNPQEYRAIQLAQPKGMQYMNHQGVVCEMVFERDLQNLNTNVIDLMRRQIRGMTTMDREADKLLGQQKQKLLDEQIERLRKKYEESSSQPPSVNIPSDYTEQQMKMMEDQIKFDEEWEKKYK